MFIRTLLILILSALTSVSVYATELTIQPRIDTSYRPHPGTDEGGFWYRVDKLEKDIRLSPYRVKDETLNQYVNEIVCKLAGEYCASIRVYIMDNPHFNATMYPNGMMQVWTGLLLRVENEAQLAAILGHEIGHYLQTHQIQQWRNRRDGSVAVMFVDLGIAAFTGVYGLATLGFSGSAAHFSREHEREADTIGLQLMARAGYDPREAGILWQNVVQEQQRDKSKSSRSLFWASHPASEDRATTLTRQAEQIISSHPGEYAVKEAGVIKQLRPHYQSFMSNHLNLQEYQQTEYLLEHHKQMGYPKHLVDFFYGELYRLRGEAHDLDKATEAYQRAIQMPEGIGEAHKQLGYIYLKNKKNVEAKQQFSLYLEKSPEASDSAMINYYLSNLR